MFDNAETYPVQPSLMGAEKSVMNITPTMTERLRHERDNLKQRLAEVEAALSTIEANPQVQQVIDALTKLHWLR